MPDYYQVLGVAKTATQDEIRKAYRKLAHQYHPDTGRGDEAKFKEVNEAYKVIGSPERRAQYDRFGEAGVNIPSGGGAYGGASAGDWQNVEDIFSGFGGFTDFGDIFSDIFGVGRRRQGQPTQRGVNVEVGVTITLEEAFKGAQKEISLDKFGTCTSCQGSGAEPGSSVITCPRCHGQGQIRAVQQTIFGSIATAQICERCGGTGKVPEKACSTCYGSGRLRRTKTLVVNIPAGIENGARVRIAGEGEAGYRGTKPGDLYINVRIEPDPRFRREGDNIYVDRGIDFVQAALGDNLLVPTLDGEAELKVPAGTQPGTVFRMKNKGMTKIRGGRGDQYVKVNVTIPTKLSREQKKLLEEIKKHRSW